MRPPRAALLAALATASSLLGDQMLYAVLPSYYPTLGLQPYQVGLLLSVNRLVRLASNHVAERLCRRLSLASLMTGALALGAGLNLVYGLATTFAALLTARVVWGVCWSFIRQIGIATVVDGAADAHMGRLMGFYSGISRMGSISGNLLGAMAHDLVGFTAALGLLTAASLAGVPLGPLSRRGLPRSQPSDPARSGGAGAGLVLCGFASGCVGQGLLAATLGAVLNARLGPQETGAGLGIASLTGLLLASRWVADLSAPALGAVTDTVGRRGAAASFLAAGAAVLAVAALPSVSSLGMIAAVLVFHLCATGEAVSLQAEAGSRGPRAVAAYATACDLGSAVGPNLGWLALQLGLGVGSVFVLGSGLYAVASAIAWRILARRCLPP